MTGKVTMAAATAGHAEGGTTLNAFDNALLAAGIGNINLIKVSSILPPEVPVIDLPKIKPGAIVPTAYAAMTSETPGEIVAAAVGYALPDDPAKNGVIMEFHGVASKAEAERQTHLTATKVEIEIASNRGAAQLAEAQNMAKREVTLAEGQGRAARLLGEGEASRIHNRGADRAAPVKAWGRRDGLTRDGRQPGASSGQAFLSGPGRCLQPGNRGVKVRRPDLVQPVGCGVDLSDKGGFGGQQVVRVHGVCSCVLLRVWVTMQRGRRSPSPDPDPSPRIQPGCRMKPP